VIVFLRRFAFIALTGIALAGCGGGMSSLAPSGGTQSASSASRAPQALRRTNVLYVAYEQGVVAYPLSVTSPSDALATVTVGQNDIVSSIATDGSGNLAILKNYFVNNVEYCATLIEPPVPNGTAAATPNLCDPVNPTQAEGIARGATGFDVLYRTSYTNITTQSYAVERLDSTGAVASTLPLPTGGLWGSIATSSAGKDFVGEVGSVLKYAATDTDPAKTLASIVLPTHYYPWAIAVAPDATLYVAAGHTGQLTGEVIYAYPPGSTTPARTIGPIANSYVTALAVDDQGLLYVGLHSFGAAVASNKIRVYAADANGAAVPLRGIVNPVTSYDEIVGLAISQ
jgi:hypothetical protein